jgi:hypothetical protein
LRAIALGLFGISEMNEALRLFSKKPPSWKSLCTYIMSPLKTSQHTWKKARKKPLGPGALSPTIADTTFLTSSSSKALSNQLASDSKIELKEIPSTKGLHLHYLEKSFW